jgi:hypothetical protein
MKARGQLEDTRVGGSIILNWILDVLGGCKLDYLA